MKSITRQKPLDEIKEQLGTLDGVFIVGCGTCATLTKTGGMDQVASMKASLQEWGKRVSGWTVIPVACDETPEVGGKDKSRAIQTAGCVLAMTCALGVHRMNLYMNKPIIPALDTLFIGVEESPGYFREACAQCGRCVLGETAGICPVTACHKGLMNGPCGGTNNGKCEVDRERDCAWTLIYERLKQRDQLEFMRKYQPPKNFQVAPRPRAVKIA